MAFVPTADSRLNSRQASTERSVTIGNGRRSVRNSTFKNALAGSSRDAASKRASAYYEDSDGANETASNNRRDDSFGEDDDERTATLLGNHLATFLLQCRNSPAVCDSVAAPTWTATAAMTSSHCAAQSQEEDHARKCPQRRRRQRFKPRRTRTPPPHSLPKTRAARANRAQTAPRR